MEPINCLSTLPPVIERYELKYVIPYRLIEPVSDFLLPYCVFDNHSTAFADRFYPVNSLYFDSPNYRFLKQRMWGADRRFNMRIRAYGNGEEGDYYAEIKYKTPTSVKKFRAVVKTDEWPHFLRQVPERSPIGALRDKAQISRQLFLRLAESYAVEPKIFTCYRRRALFSRIDDYARVTFDIDMRYRPQDPLQAADPYSLSPARGCINYDTPNIYGDEIRYADNVILELKTTSGAVPVWMIELIRRFELKQVGFSKYLASSMIEHTDNAERYMTADRLAPEWRLAEPWSAQATH